jgi:TFIIF-interacting CTD phosphatase-like protein
MAMTPLPQDNRILLILDLDETLLHASDRRLDQEPDCVVGPYFVYVRPHLAEFLMHCRERFQIAVWSSSSADYAAAVVRAMFPVEVEPFFIWSRERCIQRFDGERHQMYFVKDLKKVRRRGFDLDRVLIVEDTPKKVERNYGNAIYVQPYFGDPDDSELTFLARYLESLASLPNVRSIEKRGWRRKVS